MTMNQEFKTQYNNKHMNMLTVIKHMIENPQWIGTINEDLFTKESRTIIKTAKVLYTKGRQPTFQSIEYLLEKKEANLAIETLREAQRQNSIDQTTFQLQLEDVRQQAEHRLFTEMANVDYSEPKVRYEYYKKLDSIQSIETPTDQYELSSFFDFEDFIKAEEDIIQTFSFLDGTGAELYLGALCTLIALTGGGKSLVKGVLARKLIEQGRRVLYIGFEEMKTDFNIRIGRGVLQHTEHQFKQLDAQQIRTNLRKHYVQPGIEKGELDFMQVGTIYIEDLEDMVEKLEEQQGYMYDVVMVDYSDYVKKKTGKKNIAKHEEIEDVFRGLKEFAMKPNKKRLVITSVQANRDAYKKTMSPKLEHIAGSMGPAKNSDLVLGIFRLPVNEDNTQKMASQMKPNDITSTIQFTVRKKRPGSINEGDTFYFNMRADNNLVPITGDALPRAEQLFNLNSLEDLDKYS